MCSSRPSYVTVARFVCTARSSLNDALDVEFSEEGFKAEVKSVTLLPHSSEWITLWLKPERCGKLEVKGVRWELKGNPRTVGRTFFRFRP